MNRATSSPPFAVMASGATTAALLLSLSFAFLFGALLPQRVPLDAIAAAYPTSVTQMAGRFGLADVVSSWPVSALTVLLVLNLLAIGVRRFLLGDLRTGGSRLAAAQRAGVTGIRDSDDLRGRSRAWVPFRFRFVGSDRVEGRSGFFVEGLALVLLGGVALAASAWVARTTDTTGEIRVITSRGPEDRVAASRQQAVLLTGDRSSPWKPGFELSCADAKDSGPLSPRWCSFGKIRSSAAPKVAQVVPGFDLDYAGYRFTLTGVERVAGLGQFDVWARGPAGRSRVPAAILEPLDISEGGQPIASASVTGDGADEPAALVPVPGVPRERVAEVTLLAQPRTELRFAVGTERYLPYLWAGVTLLLIGLLLCAVLPGYRLRAVRAEGGWTVAVFGTGVLCHPEGVLDGIQRGGSR